MNLLENLIASNYNKFSSDGLKSKGHTDGKTTVRS